MEKDIIFYSEKVINIGNKYWGKGRKQTDRKQCNHQVNDTSAKLKPKSVISSI